MDNQQTAIVYSLLVTKQERNKLQFDNSSGSNMKYAAKHARRRHYIRLYENAFLYALFMWSLFACRYSLGAMPDITGATLTPGGCNVWVCPFTTPTMSTSWQRLNTRKNPFLHNNIAATLSVTLLVSDESLTLVARVTLARKCGPLLPRSQNVIIEVIVYPPAVSFFTRLCIVRRQRHDIGAGVMADKKHHTSLYVADRKSVV